MNSTSPLDHNFSVFSEDEVHQGLFRVDVRSTPLHQQHMQASAMRICFGKDGRLAAGAGSFPASQQGRLQWLL